MNTARTVISVVIVMIGLFANIRPVKAYDTLLDKSPLRKKNIKGIPT